MGGVAQPILTSALKEAGDRYGKAIISSEGELLKSEAGKWVLDTYNEFTTAVKKDASAFVQGRIQQIPHNATPVLKQTIAAQNANEMKSATGMATMLNDKTFFGPNRERLSQAVALAKQQRGPVHANNVADIASVLLKEENPKQFKDASGNWTTWRKVAGSGISSSSPYKATRDVDADKAIKGFLAKSYLGRVAIPHTMQHLNTMLTDGLVAWTKASRDMLVDKNAIYKVMETMPPLFEETHRTMLDIAEGKDTILNKFIHMPGFSTVRKWEIAHAALAGKYSAIDASKNFLQTGSKASQLQLEMLGLKPGAIRAAGQLTQDDIETAMFRSADENLFITHGVKTPWVWDETPTSRMLSLYKHFQFREGKLIKDSIKRGLSGGPVGTAKTLAILGTAFPVAGEMIASMENLATGRNPFDRKNILHPTGNAVADNVIDAYSHMAAFGIWYSLFRAVSFRRGSDWVEGPVFSLLMDGLQSGLQLSKGNPKSAIKSVARRVPVVGPAIAAHVDDISGSVSDTIDSIEDWAKR